MRIWSTCEREGVAVDGDLVDTASGSSDAVADRDAAVEECQLHAQAVELPGDDGIHAQRGGLAAQAQKAPHDQPQSDACAAGVHAPTAIEVDGPRNDQGILLTGLVTVGKSGIGAGVVAIGLAERCPWHDGADPNRVGLTQRMEEALGLPYMRQSLGEAQMRMGVHQADLATEKR